MPKLSFDTWKARVQQYVLKQTGMTCDDLPDVDYYSMWENGDSPREAATEAIKYAMEN